MLVRGAWPFQSKEIQSELTAKEAGGTVTAHPLARQAG
jgi:hypothetical protein